MMAQNFVFYCLASVLLASAAVVVSARNPVHAVLFLILAFFNAAGLMIMLGAEFIAMIFVIVYVGAVAVLFLFVVMMLDVNFVDLRRGARRYALVGGLVGLVLLAELVLVAWHWQSAILPELAAQNAETADNVAAIGTVLYTEYILGFQLAGGILLLAMIGAIVLTLRRRDGVKRQNIARQIARRKEETLELADPPVGSGIKS